MKITVVKAQVEHCQAIADNVREADKAEIFALCALTPLDALLRSWAVSGDSWTALFDGEPACMFGVAGASLITDTGRPWMIGTNLLDRYPLAFLRACKPYVLCMAVMFWRLENYVDVRNIRAVRWLKWLGFTMGEPEPYGYLQLPFMKFHMER